MRPSELDTYIHIVARNNEVNELNEPVDSLEDDQDQWQPVFEMFAKRTFRPGREFFQASRVSSEARVYFTIRPHFGIKTDHRVLHGMDRYEITAVTESDKRGDAMQLECKAVS